ncbi:MAG: phosphoglycerate kinase, partial [Chlamydiae bacterium]|nr:phosphoglycerate kinase [Chlamydiota bacterium]
AYTFFKAKGVEIGASICEDDLLEKAKQFVQAAEKKKVPLYFPLDLVIADRFDNEADTEIIDVEKGVKHGWQGVDIGPKTVSKWRLLLLKAQMIFWNGPLGVFEFPNFSKGTEEVAQIIAISSATTIIGGGDSVAAINQLGLSDRFTHISTGGGASLEYIEQGHLPGIDALTDVNSI